ncbi:putative stomagen [Helianthus anomalus]
MGITLYLFKSHYDHKLPFSPLFINPIRSTFNFNSNLSSLSFSKATMANTKLLFYFLWATLLLQGVSGEIFTSRRGLHLQSTNMELMNTNIGRRSKIGSVIPTCTFNECRGCRHNCRAEQVPVEGNDPISSAYRYRCVCHG